MGVLDKVKKIFPNSEERHEKRASRNNDGETLVDVSPYYTSPSFIAHGGKVATVVQLYSTVGSNRNMRFQEVIDFIPVDPMDDVDIHMFINDTLITGDEKKRLITDNASGGKEYFDTKEKHNMGKESAADKATDVVEAETSEVEDYSAYEVISSRPDPIMCFRISLMIVGKSREAVEEQRKILNTSLDKRHPGAQWDSVGGDQAGRFSSLLDTYKGSRLDMTATAQNYARLNFGVSPGLTDRNGVPIGRDAMALSQTDSSVDFDRYLRNQAIIATSPGATMPDYELEPDETNAPPLSSQLAQVAANQITANGHRAHHIVLNGWDYCTNEERNYVIPSRMRQQVFAHYDVSRVTINLMQGFGEYDDVVGVYDRLTEKIVNIFDVLQDMKLDKSDRAAILDVVQNFYFANGLYKSDAAERPRNTQIVKIANPETYPTSVALMSFFKNRIQQTKGDNTELSRDRLTTLYSILNQTMSANTAVIGRTTSISETDAPQVYYDFSNLSSDRIRQVQLLNMMGYISYTADKGDVIVIHGMERVYGKVSQYLHRTIEAAQKRGVRFIFAFDSITAPISPIAEMSDLFGLHGTYYQNLDSNVDYTIIGKCEPNEVDEFGKLLNTELSDSIIRQMQVKSKNQILFHRSVGRVNNFVSTRAVI